VGSSEPIGGVRVEAASTASCRAACFTRRSNPPAMRGLVRYDARMVWAADAR
jgi:hypothetical protein